jgi:PH domain
LIWCMDGVLSLLLLLLLLEHLHSMAYRVLYDESAIAGRDGEADALDALLTGVRTRLTAREHSVPSASTLAHELPLVQWYCEEVREEVREHTGYDLLTRPCVDLVRLLIVHLRRVARATARVTRAAQWKSERNGTLLLVLLVTLFLLSVSSSLGAACALLWRSLSLALPLYLLGAEPLCRVWPHLRARVHFAPRLARLLPRAARYRRLGAAEAPQAGQVTLAGAPPGDAETRGEESADATLYERVMGVGRAADAERVLKEGYLTKRGAKRKNWRRRYFVLRRGSVQYFKSSADTKPAGTIDLRDGFTLYEVPDASKANSFSLTERHVHRSYLMYAEHPQDMREWMHAIFEQSLLDVSRLEVECYAAGVQRSRRSASSHQPPPAPRSLLLDRSSEARPAPPRDDDDVNDDGDGEDEHSLASPSAAGVDSTSRGRLIASQDGSKRHTSRSPVARLLVSSGSLSRRHQRSLSGETALSVASRRLGHGVRRHHKFQSVDVASSAATADAIAMATSEANAARAPGSPSAASTSPSLCVTEAVEVDPSRSADHSGWVHKKRTDVRMSGWLKRWMWLRDCTIYYATGPGDRVRGSIPVTHDTLHDAKESSRAHCFELRHEHRTWYISVSDETSYQGWVTAINRTLHRLRARPRTALNLEQPALLGDPRTRSHAHTSDEAISNAEARSTAVPDLSDPCLSDRQQRDDDGEAAHEHGPTDEHSGSLRSASKRHRLSQQISRPAKQAWRLSGRVTKVGGKMVGASSGAGRSFLGSARVATRRRSLTPNDADALEQQQSGQEPQQLELESELCAPAAHQEQELAECEAHQGRRGRSSARMSTAQAHVIPAAVAATSPNASVRSSP